MKRPSQRPVSLEDLLRLKRAERPPEAFWADFDRGLREKQLAALLRSRPWWQRWADGGFWPALGRLALPVGAIGLIAGLFLVPRPNGEEAAGPALALSSTENVPVAVVAAEMVAVAAEGVAVAAVPAPALEAAAAVEERASVEPVALAAAEAVSPAVTVGEPAAAPARVAKDALPAAWAAGGQTETLVAASLLGGTKRFEPRASNARSVVEPLQQMVPPGERRGTRILTAMVAAGAGENGPRASERFASRLSEERLYDQIERFGARGAGVNVRF
ncbi:MAG: hypothetical protein FJ397_05910 [Verrucomicrobia bacterium]|nr:hypothetical protein [Verrucomicrobiota bacterium]